MTELVEEAAMENKIDIEFFSIVRVKLACDNIRVFANE